jgi:hypothetical protein
MHNLTSWTRRCNLADPLLEPGLELAESGGRAVWQRWPVSFLPVAVPLLA